MAKPKVRNIINILTNRPSLEAEFAVESAIKELSTIKNINELKELASQLARANFKQSHFIANALEMMCTQQECIQFYERKLKKKAPLMKRLKYILFGKD
tara:strand:+ start:414 stop:710 length:297 start_codon:yes stop_codon:yes gene_type:complete